MIHTSKQLMKELLRGYGDNKPLIVTYILIIPLLLLLYLNIRIKLLQETPFDYSVADCFVFLLDRFFAAFTLIPLSVFLLFQIFKNDFTVPFLLRQNSKSILWLKQIFKIIVSASLLVAYIALVAFLIASVYSTDYINWGSEQSLYYYINQASNDEAQLWQVIAMFFVMCTLLISIVNILFQFLYWLTNNRVVAWISIFFIAVWDNAQGSFFILYGRLSIHQSYWYDLGDMASHLFAGLSFIVILSIGGIFIAKKRDFLNEGI